MTYRLSDEQREALVDALLDDEPGAREDAAYMELAWPVIDSIVPVVASLLAAARAEGAEKARAEVTERVEAVLSIWEGARPGSLLSTVFVTEKVRAALAGGERDE